MSTVTLVLAFLFLAYHLSLIANGWWNSRRAQEFTIVEGPAPAPAPSTSVVIPARNEEDAIERCVTSFAAQDYPGRVEIIVVVCAHDLLHRSRRWAHTPLQLSGGSVSRSGEDPSSTTHAS